jgi:hypothetical protein
MNVDDLLGTEDLATEAGDAVFAKLDHGKAFERNEAIDAGRDRHLLHVDHVGWTDVVADAAAGALLKLDVFDHPALRLLRVLSSFRKRTQP